MDNKVSARQPDRTTAPPLHRSAVMRFSTPQPQRLAGGVPAYVIPGGEQEVCRIEWIFRAGMREAGNFMVPGAVSHLLLQGTGSRSAESVAEHFEYYGASVDCGCTADYAAVALVCLTRFLPEVLPVVAEVLSGAAFPEDEIALFRTQGIQRLQVQNKKISFVSKRILGQALFGGRSPYGYRQTEKDFNDVQREHLVHFHERTYRQSMLAVIASGQVDDNTVRLIDASFGAWRAGDTRAVTVEEQQTAPARIDEPWAGSVQTSIRLGRRLFDRHHPDFIPLKILDCVLGGYFGSRLMMNIREDKGYSYGIGSGVVSLDGSGYLYVATEVNKEAREAALREIFLEMKRLRDETLPVEELTTVTSYLGGMLQRSFDGPFSVAGSFRTVLLQGLGFEYYDRYQEALASVTPAMLKELAAKYLVDDRFWSVTVG